MYLLFHTANKHVGVRNLNLVNLCVRLISQYTSFQFPPQENMVLLLKDILCQFFQHKFVDVCLIFFLLQQNVSYPAQKSKDHYTIFRSCLFGWTRRLIRPHRQLIIYHSYWENIQRSRSMEIGFKRCYVAHQFSFF